MKTIKMSLANMQGQMSQEEMKSIMAGSGAYESSSQGQSCYAHGRYDTCMSWPFASGLVCWLG